MSLASSASISHAHEVATEMVAAANQFLGALSPELKEQATFPLADPEREDWHFVPKARNGASLKAMNARHQELAMALLRTGLSHPGMMRAEAVISLESV
ncbi:MAG: DUF3500 domain-containing protein, partial [Opitutaceae bacterium]